MPRKLLVADLLCGAGGSSTGCVQALLALGWSIEEIILVCLNHWPIAIETHRRNHPEARHYCQDIATVRPHLIVPEGYLDLLMASPTCTHHSVARGGKPTSDQQRSDPWHIITWLTELRVKRMIIENVWEFIGWGPVDVRTGKPIKARKGEYFRAWIETIRRLGYEPEWRKLNAADYGDATTRQRFILMARNDRRPVTWPAPTHRKRDDKVALMPGTMPWRPARDIIDWNIKGRSIFNRKRPLALKTLARIYAGAVKFKWPEPFLVLLRKHMAEEHGTDVILNALPPPPASSAAGPVLITLRNNMDGQSIDAPAPTIAARGTHIGLAEPVIVKQNFRRDIQGVGEPVPTIMTVARIGVAEPVIVSPRHGKEGAGPRPRSADDPLPTITGGGSQFAVAEPFVLSRQGGGAPRSIEEPTPTQCAKHSQVLISPYYGSGSGETCSPASEPLPTVTSKGRFGMVVPITHSGASNRARDVDTDPLPTLTTANRGELAFITAQHGERPGQAPRVHDIAQPAPTIAASGHIDLVEATPEYDILFRMLEPHELAAAMGFTGEEASYEFAGTKTEQIKQIGNAVSVAKMKACVKAIMADAVPARKAPEAEPARAAAGRA